MSDIREASNPTFEAELRLAEQDWAKAAQIAERALQKAPDASAAQTRALSVFCAANIKLGNYSFAQSLLALANQALERRIKAQGLSPHRV